MSSLLSILLRIFKMVVLCYAVVATVYTLLVPLVGFLPLNSSLRVSVDFLLSPSRRISELGSGASLYSNVGPGKLRWAEEPVYWRPSPNFFFKTSPRVPLSMTEELFLNKAFSQSLQPTNIVPFYYRSSKSSEKQPSYEDISIATLVTSSRFMVLAKLARKYQGPISVAIHISNTPKEQRDAVLRQLHNLYITSPAMSTWVDVHLILDGFDRQFNMWRNVARFFARTEFVVMLDVDFAVCTDFRNRVLRSPAIMDKLRHGDAALVIPAFEFVDQQDGQDADIFPMTKEELRVLYDSGKIEVFHRSWTGGHNSTEYRRYFDAAPGDVYKVQAYQHAYEPYVIFLREGPPWCEERFIGYGGNKAACLYEMYLGSGMSFYVLPDFVIHQSHPYDEETRKAERKYNKQLYIDFREETCLRYLHFSLAMGELDTVKGVNLQIECQKVPGVSGLAVDMISALGK